MTLRRMLIVIPLAVLFLAACTWYWLLHSQSGARWLVGRVESASDNSLSVGAATGDLGSGLVLSDLVFEADNTDVSITDLKFEVDVDILSRTAEIGPAHLSGVRVQLSGDEETQSSKLTEVLGNLQLPVLIRVSGLEMDDARISRVNAEEIVVRSASLAGRWQDEIEIDRFHLDMPGIRVEGDARLELSGRNDFAANLRIRLDAAFSGLDVPLNLDASATGTPESIEVHLSSNEPAAFLMAKYDVATSNVTGNLRWENVSWPMGTQQPRVSSRRGQMTVSGAIDSWSVSGSLALDVPQLPPGQFVIEGEGNRDRAAVNIAEGNVLGGKIAGHAEYSWRGRHEYEASLDVESIHTDALIPDWPAVLSGKLNLIGQRKPSQLSVTLAGMHGELVGAELVANGRIEFRENIIAVEDVSIRHGSTNLRAEGQLYEQSGLHFDIMIDELARYVDQGSGSLRATGLVSLNADNPLFRVDASSDAISYRDFHFTDVSINDLNFGDAVIETEVTVGASDFAGIAIDSAQLKSSLYKESQSLTLSIMENDWRVTLALAGTLDDWEQPASWAGQIGQLEVVHDSIQVTLSEPAGIHVSRQSTTVDRLCMSGDRGIELCTDVGWAADGGFDIDADISSVPVDIVNAFVDTQLTFDQMVLGKFNWQQTSDGRSTGRVDIAMTPGTITSINHPDLQVSTSHGELSFDVVDDNLLSGIVNLPFPDLGHISGEFEVLDATNDKQSNVTGRIDVILSDVGLLAEFLPVVDDAGGKLRANLDVSGRATEPTYVGEVVLENGHMHYLPIGLELDEVQLISTIKSDGDIEMSGSFRAGEGRAQIVSRSGQDRTKVTGIEVGLRGDNLTVINVTDVTAVADADIGIIYDGERLQLNGQLSIPSAQITPASIGTSKVSESEDVYIIAGELPDSAVAETLSSDLQITGSLAVHLGNDFIIDLELAKANLTGTTTFSWSGEHMPNANGRFDLEGDILALGQKLEIVEGGLRFPDVPANDPHIRIRAEREIYGNTQVRRAGVLVDGTIRHTTVEAYTNPPTTEQRALTLLVTGSDFDFEKGVGAVDFGTYIAPKIYASYGIGLFSTENVIRIRYDLARGFGITGTSGQKDSGLDLNYRFEN